MKLLPNNLYSRLALITSITLVAGYLVVYAWTNIDASRYAWWATLTSTLMTDIMANMTDLNTRVSNFTFSSGNVGIGATTTTLGNQSSVKLVLNWTAGAKNWQMDVGALTTGYLNFTPSTVNAGTTFTTPVMVIWDTGNVGIGTTSPRMKLDVNGGVVIGDTVNFINLYKYNWNNFIENVWGSMFIRTSPGNLIIWDTWWNVWIWTTAPWQKLDIAGGNGRVASWYSWLTNSDSRYKKNITTLQNVLEKIWNIRWVNYDLKEDKNIIKWKWKYIWVIAQEVEKEFPELVVTEDNWYKSVKYSEISAVLIEAVKEQQKEIEELKDKITRLENR